jgi:hypothetical protein
MLLSHSHLGLKNRGDNMPELNANIPPIECYVRGNFLRNQKDSHDKYFPCVVFGVASIKSRSPLFHIMMEDGGSMVAYAYQRLLL